jgi:hypothetical protein
VEKESRKRGFEGIARQMVDLQAVLFDLDGTLIDTIPTYFFELHKRCSVRSVDHRPIEGL